MRITRRPARSLERTTFWALAGVALLVSHDAVYLAQVGPGAPLAGLLRTAGHGYWSVASLLLLAVALVAGLGVAIRVLRLCRRAAALGAQSRSDPGVRRRFLRTWAACAAAVAVAFAIQENVEHLIVHGHAPLAGALLGPEHPLALPVICLVAGLAAAVATLVGGAHQALVEAIAEALRALARAPRNLALRPPSRLVAVPASVLAGGGAGRAPPLMHSLRV